MSLNLCGPRGHLYISLTFCSPCEETPWIAVRAVCLSDGQLISIRSFLK